MQTKRTVAGLLAGGMLAALLLLLVSACGADPTPTPLPTATPTATPRAVAPAATPTPAKPAWQVTWDETLAKAKQEGTVNCTCVPVPPIRDAIVEEWTKDYPGIKMEYSFATLPDIEPQVTAERAAGRNIRDVYNWSASPEQYVFNDRGFFVDLRPLMILPEVSSEAAWRGGFEERFQDTAKRTVFGAGASVTTFAINTQKHKELGLELPKSALDFLKPQYKGKIVVWDLRFGGGGANLAGWWNFYFGLDDTDGLGALLKQDLLVVPAARPVAENMIRGGYLIGVSAPGETDYVPFRQAGLTFTIDRFGNAPLQGTLSPGWSPSVFKNAPHPNASTILFNWMLSKSTHERVFKRIVNNSARLDVPAYEPASSPVTGETYFQGQTESGLKAYRIPAMEAAKTFYR